MGKGAGLVNAYRVFVLGRPLKNVFEAVDTRQRQAKKRSACTMNEYFEFVLNVVATTQIVSHRSVHTALPCDSVAAAY